MFLKLRNRIKQRGSNKSPTGKQSRGRNATSIFRNKKSATFSRSGVPSVEPAVTFTLSQDEEEDTNQMNNDISSVVAELDVKSPKVQKIKQYIFTEEEMIAHGVNQVKMMAAKEAEIAKLQRVHEELNERYQQAKVELEQTQEELADKERELQETYHELSEIDEDLTDTKMELYDTKQKLVEVSSSLMQCQHKMIETKMSLSLWRW